MRIANVVAISVAMFCFALVMLFPRTIFGIFTQDTELIEVGSRAMRIVLILPRCFGVTGVWASFPAADFVATAITIIWLRFEMRKLHIVGCEEEPEMHEGCVELRMLQRFRDAAGTRSATAPRRLDPACGSGILSHTLIYARRGART